MRGSISTILVVDDEPIIADTLAAILNHAEFKSTAVYSGTDVVREVIRLKPEVVICDVIMPDMTGIDAAIEIQPRWVASSLHSRGLTTSSSNQGLGRVSG